jgi:DNA-binding SARP family transcriptional activator
MVRAGGPSRLAGFMGEDRVMHELCVRLLGSFQITVGGEPAGGSVLPKAQELLALLLLSPQRHLMREIAADVLWPSLGVDASRKAMRQVLWQIHQAADGGVPADGRLVLTDGPAVRANPDRPVWLDVELFKAATRAAQATMHDAPGEPELAELTRASDLYRGPLLAGCYSDWCLEERAHLEDLYLTLLDRLSTGYERRGALEPAIRWAERLLEVEPAHERSHRRLMHLYYRTDDRTRALRQYRRCVWVLERELGVRPSGRTEQLAAAIAADAGRDASQLDDLGGRPPAPAVVLENLDEFRAEIAALRASVDAVRDQLRRSTV